MMRGSGAAHAQDFDVLGTGSSVVGTPLPPGWAFTAHEVIFNALVTDVTINEAGELDFRALGTDTDLQALRLGFDIEAWQLRSALGANLGEAAIQVVLEADSGSGFVQIADLGIVSTGKTLKRPATGSRVDDNDPAYRMAYDSGPVEVDVPVGATLRTRWIGTDSSRNVVFGLDNVSLRFAAVGDANVDGLFNSTDLVQIFTAVG